MYLERNGNISHKNDKELYFPLVKECNIPMGIYGDKQF